MYFFGFFPPSVMIENICSEQRWLFLIPKLFPEKQRFFEKYSRGGTGFFLKKGKLWGHFFQTWFFGDKGIFLKR